jgi:hypothetical protein
MSLLGRVRFESKREFNILVLCFNTHSNKLNKKTKPYLETQNIFFYRSEGQDLNDYLTEWDYDYIGSEKARLNGKLIDADNKDLTKNGVNSEEVLSYLHSVPYNYDIIVYEFCTINHPGVEEAVLSPASIFTFKNKLTENGKFVFLTGERAYPRIIVIMDKYNFSNKIITNQIIEFIPEK